MDRRKFLSRGAALAGGLLMPGDPEPEEIHRRTHGLRVAWEHAEPGAAARLDQHAAAVARGYVARPDRAMATAFADAAQSVAMAALSSGMAGAAEAMAADGNGYGAFSELDKAEVDYILAREHPRPEWARTWGENWLTSWRGTCAVRLGRPHLAVRPFQQVMARTPARMVLAKAEARLGLAHAAFADHDVEGACSLLGQAVVDLRRGGDAQHLRQAFGLRGHLARRHGETRYVRELDEVIRSVV